jgi:Zn-finger nucleic acid-binding protein
MKCPNCDETLVMTERQGVEIDYCPKCRGVWLDKGELDKIIEKSNADLRNQNRNDDNRFDDDDDDDGGLFNRGRRDKEGNNPNRRRGGFLGNLFDFD